jgi:hypothetical protein
MSTKVLKIYCGKEKIASLTISTGKIGYPYVED